MLDTCMFVIIIDIISITRYWNASPSSVTLDQFAAHTLISMLTPNKAAIKENDGVGALQQEVMHLSSAALTAIVPISMKLLDRYQSHLHSLGLYLLLVATGCTPSGTLGTFLDWILPHLFQYIE